MRIDRKVRRGPQRHFDSEMLLEIALCGPNDPPLDLRRLAELLNGPSLDGSAFFDEAERRAAWQVHKRTLIACGRTYGVRPWAATLYGE